MTITLDKPESRAIDISWWQRTNKTTAAMVAVLAAMFVFFSATADSFLTQSNISNILTQSAPIITIAVAMTFVISTGQIDLSVGATAAFVAATSAELLRTGLDSIAVVPIVILLGAAWGMLNGWLFAYQGIPSFIVTLATMSVIRGVAQYRTEGYSIPISKTTLIGKYGQGTLFGLSYMVWTAALIVAVGYLILHHTKFGNYVNGIGSQEESVRRAGVNISRIKLLVLTSTGVAAAIAGIMIAARLGSGSANSGVGLELTVISAVVLGGTNLFGGQGSVLGSVVGAIIIGMLGNGLVLLGVNAFMVPIVTGLVLIAALWINTRGLAIRANLKSGFAYVNRVDRYNNPSR